MPSYSCHVLARLLCLIGIGAQSLWCADGLISSACVEEEKPESEPGSALLQMRAAPASVNLTVAVDLCEEEEEEGEEEALVLKEEGCSAEQGTQSPLDAAGYATVNKACCLAGMDTWLRRLFTSKNWELCFEGGLSGFLPFVTCKPQFTYVQLINGLMDVLNSTCPWLGKSGQCLAAWPAGCPTAPNNPAWHRRRSCSKPPTGTCCKPDSSLVQVTPSTPTLLARTNFSKAITNVAPIDCTHGLPIQVLGRGQSTQSPGPWEASALNISTGTYDKLFDIPTTMTSPEFTFINSCAVGPQDSILYCTIELNNDPKEQYIVRLDKDRVEFVAKIPKRGASSYNAGAFNTKGVFYWASQPSVMYRVAGLEATQGYASQSDAGLRDLTAYVGTKPAGWKGNADIVAIVADLEGAGKDSEYILCLTNNGIFIAKDMGTGCATTGGPQRCSTSYKTWPLTATGYPSNNGGFGAGWNFKGHIFFAHGRTGDVYRVPINDLDLNNPKTIAVNVIGKADPTGFNDGANCLTAPDPFTSDCQAGMHQVPMNADGTCPAGATLFPSLH